jgi:hypothetical protein
VSGAPGLRTSFRLPLENSHSRYGHLVDARDDRLMAIFAIGLFVVEPLILDRRLSALAIRRPAATFAWLALVHWLLFTLSLITIFGAVAGSHGWLIF